MVWLSRGNREWRGLGWEICTTPTAPAITSPSGFAVAPPSSSRGSGDRRDRTGPLTCRWPQSSFSSSSYLSSLCSYSLTFLETVKFCFQWVFSFSFSFFLSFSLLSHCLCFLLGVLEHLCESTLWVLHEPECDFLFGCWGGRGLLNLWFFLFNCLVWVFQLVELGLGYSGK